MPAPTVELAFVASQFLERARERNEPGAVEYTIVATDADPGGRARGWRFDMRIALSGQSFLLTTDGRWCTAVRTGLASFGWGVIGADDLAAQMEPWADDLIRAIHSVPLDP